MKTSRDKGDAMLLVSGLDYRSFAGRVWGTTACMDKRARMLAPRFRLTVIKGRIRCMKWRPCQRICSAANTD